MLAAMRARVEVSAQMFKLVVAVVLGELLQAKADHGDFVRFVMEDLLPRCSCGQSQTAERTQTFAGLTCVYSPSRAWLAARAALSAPPAPAGRTRVLG